MTAYELADWLDNFSSVNDGDGKIMSEISEKLRKQTDEIKALKSCELTDDEILEVIRARETTSYMNFARAILRKQADALKAEVTV